MRIRIRDGLILSLVLHGIGLAWFRERAPEIAAAVEVDVAPPPSPSAPAQEVEPLVVALLEDRDGSIGSAAAPRIAAQGPRRGRMEVPPPLPEVAPSLPPASPPHRGLLTMRPPEPPRLAGPSPDFWARFEANTKPPPPKAIEGERIADEIESSRANLANPRWVANHSAGEVAAEHARHLAAEQARDEHELQPRGAGYEADHRTFVAKVDPDGTAHLIEKPIYDPTELLMKILGQDPYGSNRRRMLDATRDERFEIGKQYRTRQLARAAALARTNLASLWTHTRSTAERKTALFETWDECAETGSEELVAGGGAARAMIVGFIRARLTGDAAYTAGELATFNARRRSRAAFDPYGGPHGGDERQ